MKIVSRRVQRSAAKCEVPEPRGFALLCVPRSRGFTSGRRCSFVRPQQGRLLGYLSSQRQAASRLALHRLALASPRFPFWHYSLPSSASAVASCSSRSFSPALVQLPAGMASPSLEPGVMEEVLPATSWRGLLTNHDLKPICRLQSKDVPFPLETNLFLKARFETCPSLQGLEQLPHFSVAAMEDGNRSREWQTFLQFLWDHMRVGVVHASGHELVIQPDECPGPEKPNVATVFYAPLTTGILRRGAPRPRAQEASRPLAQPLAEGPGHMHPRYLETIAHAHSSWSFGALAELIDNAKDAKASRIEISVEYGELPGRGIEGASAALPAAAAGAATPQPMLCVSDNGQGMSHKEVVTMLSLGHDLPPSDETQRIGRFGVGFKSGTMRLGDDVIVLTQCAESRTIAFLSRTLNAHKQAVDIPIITYRKRKGGGMVLDTTKCSPEEERQRLLVIQSLTPFDSFRIGEEFLKLEEMPPGATGEDGSEEDPTQSVEDVGGKGPFSPLKQEVEEYAADEAGRASSTPPRTGTGTRIFIMNLRSVLGSPELDWESEPGNILIRSRRARSRPNQMCKDVPLDYNLRSYLKYMFLPSNTSSGPNLEMFVQGRKADTGKDLMAGLRKLVKFNKGERLPPFLGTRLNLRLGFSDQEKRQGRCGIFLYWKGRLIEAFLRVGKMQYNHDACLGILGVLETSKALESTPGGGILNCKQRFLDTPQYQELLEWVTEKVQKYWDKHFDEFTQQVVDPANIDVPLEPANKYVQCDSCDKWRKLPAGVDIPEGVWFCYKAPLMISCNVPQEEEEDGEMTTAILRDGGQVAGQPIADPRARTGGRQHPAGATGAARGDAAPGGPDRAGGAQARRGRAELESISPAGGSNPAAPTGAVTVKSEKQDEEERPMKKLRDGNA